MQALVVDDSRAARTILRRILEDVGFEVREVPEGREALELLRKRRYCDPFDLVVLEWHLPGLGGLDVARALRADDGFSGLRLLMVTTETAMEALAAALDAGVDEYAMKPFTRDVIFEKLALLGLVVP